MKFFYILFIFLISCPSAIANKLSLSSEEKNYLKNKKELILCTRREYLPFSRFKNGTYEGIASDIYKEIQNSLNTKIKVIPLENLDQENIKNNKCHIIT